MKEKVHKSVSHWKKNIEDSKIKPYDITNRDLSLLLGPC